MKKLLFLLVGLILLGCSKDDTADPNSNDNQLLLKQVTADGVVRSTYQYFQDNQIANKQYFDENGVMFRKEVFEYTSDTTYNNIHDGNDSLKEVIKYFDRPNNSFWRERFNAENESLGYRIYTFSSEECGFVLVNHFTTSNTNLVAVNAIAYTGENCNATSTSANSIGEIVFKEEWIRDGKNQSLKSVILDFFRIENQGNTTSYRRLDENDSVENDFSFDATFQYNTANYPTSEVRTYLDNRVVNFTYEYY